MDRRKKIIMSVSRFLADPAAWWEKRKWVIALGVVTVTWLHFLISMGILGSTPTLEIKKDTVHSGSFISL